MNEAGIIRQPKKNMASERKLIHCADSFMHSSGQLTPLEFGESDQRRCQQ